MTVLQIVDNVRSLLSEPLASARTFPDNTSSFWKDDELIRYFNNEQHIVANHIVQTYENYFVTSTSIDIVNDQREYDIPGDFKKAIRLEDFRNSSNPVALYPLGFNEGEDNDIPFNTTAGGAVQAYSIKGDKFVFSPRPNSNQSSGVKVYYVKQISEYISASSISDIPAEFHEVMVWGVVKRALFQQEGTTDSYVAAVNEYARLLRDLTRHAEDRQIQRPRRVKSRRRN